MSQEDSPSLQSDAVRTAIRTTRIRQAGLDPVRFGKFVASYSTEEQRLLLSLIDNSPGMFMQVESGTPSAKLLDAARMTVTEQDAWAAEKAVRLEEDRLRSRLR